MIKQILELHRGACIVRKGYIETLKRILADYRYIQRMRKGNKKGDIEK